MKSAKNKFAHTADSRFGMGDNYGSGIKAKLGKLRESFVSKKNSKKKLDTPPKALG